MTWAQSPDVGGVKDSPACNEILEIIAPLDPQVRLITEFRYRLTDDIGEKINQTVAGVIVCVVRVSEREAVLGDFEEGDAE